MKIKQLYFWLIAVLGMMGIRAMWAPATTQQAAAISKDPGMNPVNIFFGSEKQLSTACKKSWW